MPRNKDTRQRRRIQVRLSDRQCEVFDAYTVEEINQILSIALDTIIPGTNATKIDAVVLRPPEVITESIARISIKGKVISIFLPEKIEDFRLLARRLGYDWTRIAWERTVDELVVVDRAAEIGYRSLLLGIPVQVDCEEVRQKIISGKFQIEPRHMVRAITKGAYTGWFSFSYPKEEDWYSKIMRLTAAKHVDGLICVPPEHFLEVEDFAESEGFTFSQAAREQLNKIRESVASAQVIEVRPIKQRVKKNARKSSNGIPDHLKDDTP